MKYALTSTIEDILGQPIKETRDNALVRCPFHDDRHASLSVDLERGLWICFACGERGGLQSLAARMGREVNDADIALRVYEGSQNSILEEPKNFAPLAKALHESLQKARPDVVVDFIVSRHLRPQVIGKFSLGWDASNSSIAFPYYDDEEVFAIKYRGPNGHKWAEQGSRRGIYNVDDVRFKPLVILCEGESDTLAVWSDLTNNWPKGTLDLIGVGGIPGVAGSRSTWETWALDLVWSKHIFIAYDADEAGDEGSLLPMQALGDKAIRMRPAKGKDMTDHLLNGGTLHYFTELDDLYSVAQGLEA